MKIKYTVVPTTDMSDDEIRGLINTDRIDLFHNCEDTIRPFIKLERFSIAEDIAEEMVYLSQHDKVYTLENPFDTYELSSLIVSCISCGFLPVYETEHVWSTELLTKISSSWKTKKRKALWDSYFVKPEVDNTATVENDVSPLIKQLLSKYTLGSKGIYDPNSYLNLSSDEFETIKQAFKEEQHKLLNFDHSKILSVLMFSYEFSDNYDQNIRFHGSEPEFIHRVNAFTIYTSIEDDTFGCMSDMFDWINAGYDYVNNTGFSEEEYLIFLGTATLDDSLYMFDEEFVSMLPDDYKETELYKLVNFSNNPVTSVEKELVYQFMHTLSIIQGFGELDTNVRAWLIPILRYGKTILEDIDTFGFPDVILLKLINGLYYKNLKHYGIELPQTLSEEDKLFIAYFTTYNCHIYDIKNLYDVIPMNYFMDVISYTDKEILGNHLVNLL